MRIIKLIFLLILSVLFIGCAASKTELAKVNQDTLKNSGVIIGTFSRNLGKGYIGVNSISILDENKKFVTRIRESASDTMSISGNPYEFKNDFVNDNEQGSLFSVSLPEGTYYITNYFAGRGLGGYTGNYTNRIQIKRGEIIYLGDIKFTPILETHPLYESKKNIVSANCKISNQLDRDFSHFKKVYSLFNKSDIITKLDEKEFALGSFHSNANVMMMFLPPSSYK